MSGSPPKKAIDSSGAKTSRTSFFQRRYVYSWYCPPWYRVTTSHFSCSEVWQAFSIRVNSAFCARKNASPESPRVAPCTRAVTSSIRSSWLISIRGQARSSAWVRA